MFEEIVERLTSHYTGDKYLSELKVAREDYFRKAGKVFEDEPIFETRMNAFLEWYLFDRPLWDSGLPPVRLYINMYGETLDEGRRNILRGLDHSIHSLFLMSSGYGSTVQVKDLIHDQTHTVSVAQTPIGPGKGDIFESRVIPMPQQKVFSDVLWVHPREAHDFIQSEVTRRKRQNNSDWEEFLFDLAYMKLKSDRYQHVSPNQIYSSDSKLGDRS